MKKEITAAALLIVIIITAALNTVHIEAMTADVTRCLERSERAAMRGDAEIALDGFGDAFAIWDSQRDYGNVFIRHTELDSCYDMFYELEEALLSGEEENLPSVYSRLKYHISAISYMERPSCGSIF